MSVLAAMVARKIEAASHVKDPLLTSPSAVHRNLIPDGAGCRPANATGGGSSCGNRDGRIRRYFVPLSVPKVSATHPRPDRVEAGGSDVPHLRPTRIGEDDLRPRAHPPDRQARGRVRSHDHDPETMAGEGRDVHRGTGAGDSADEH